MTLKGDKALPNIQKFTYTRDFVLLFGISAPMSELLTDRICRHSRYFFFQHAINIFHHSTKRCKGRENVMR